MKWERYASLLFPKGFVCSVKYELQRRIEYEYKKRMH